MTSPVRKGQSPDRVIWGAKGIGARIGRSADYVRCVLAKMPGTPIRRFGRDICVVETALIDFFRPLADPPDGD